MEQDQLDSIASPLFEAMTLSNWNNLSLDSIEAHLQRLLAQLANSLLENFILPNRIAEIQRQVEAASLLCCECGSKWQTHKLNQLIHPKTLFGNRIAIFRTQYYCPTCQTYLSVADQVLELPSHQMTPRLASVVAFCGASWSYALTSAFLEFLLGVEVSDKTVERFAKDEQQMPAPLPQEPLKEPPCIVTADGVLIRGRKKDSLLEMKVASFFSQVVEGSHNRRQVQDASFVASAAQEWREFVSCVSEEANRQGLSGWEEVEFVSDGAEGIWQMQEMVFPRAKKRLDLYHSKCKVGERIKQAYRGSAKKEEIEERVEGYIEKGMIDEAINYLKPVHNSEAGFSGLFEAG